MSWLFRLVGHREVINLPNALDIVDFFAYRNHITPVLEYGYNSGQCPTPIFWYSLPMNWTLLSFGVVLLICLGIAGFLYRSYAERPQGPLACTADAKLCPDGTGLGRTGSNCTFPACPPPNVEFPDLSLAFALPFGYSEVAGDMVGVGTEGIVAEYEYTNGARKLVIRRFTLAASTTTSDFIRQNAILSPADMRAPATALTSAIIGSRRYTMVTIERFEGVVDVAYYLAREGDVLRFDAIDYGADWTNPDLDIAGLPAQKDLRALLATLQGV